MLVTIIFHIYIRTIKKLILVFLLCSNFLLMYRKKLIYSVWTIFMFYFLTTLWWYHDTLLIELMSLFFLEKTGLHCISTGYLRRSNFHLKKFVDFQWLSDDALRKISYHCPPKFQQFSTNRQRCVRSRFVMVGPDSSTIC